MEQIPIEEVATNVNDQASGSGQSQSNSSGSNKTRYESVSNQAQPDAADSDSDSTESCGSVSDPFGAFTGDDLMVRLDGDDVERESVKRTFISGMGSAAGLTRLVAVHKALNTGSTRKARLETFAIFQKAVAEKCGGNASMRSAWYGGARDKIHKIMTNGFSSEHCVNGRVQLAPYNVALEAAKMSSVDEDGHMHLLLCTVIMGKTEIVPDGAKHEGPRFSHTDSGVDDPKNSRKFYVWSEFMNSHIMPIFVVSFKAPISLEGYNVITAAPAATTAPGTSGGGGGGGGVGERRPRKLEVNLILANLQRLIPPSDMRLVVGLVRDFCAKRITEAEMLRQVKLVTGDNFDRAMSSAAASVDAIEAKERGNGRGGGLRVPDISLRNVRIDALIPFLTRLITPEQANLINKNMSDFKAKKITCQELLRRLRFIVNDPKLWEQAAGIYKSSRQRPQPGKPQSVKKMI